MKLKRFARARWQGDVEHGDGMMGLGRDGQELSFSLASRVEEHRGTNPEELLGAAHAGCFSMSLSNLIAERGLTPGHVETTATVILEQQSGGFAIPRIDLHVRGTAEGLDAETFAELAEEAKRTCPLSKVLAAAEITLTAELIAAGV
ncbi:MAG TPA: OsmC family peroxiredoxin [Capillimicrobium sp.]|jgi:osmotically inducible protein OsmC